MSNPLARHLLPLAESLLGQFPAVVIQGARQVGKSTFAGMLSERRPSHSLTLDDPVALAAARADATEFVAQAPGKMLIIDEIQRAPELILPLKAAIDRDRTPGRFLLTGSADLLRLERTPDSLAGRAVTLNLFGLSQGELARRHDDFVAAVVEGRDPLEYTSQWSRNTYAQALGRGSFPALRDLPWTSARHWLDSYLTRIVQRDAGELQRSVSPMRLDSVLRLIAANQSGELVKARIAEQAMLPATTLPTYLDLTQTLYLATLLPPWTANLTKRVVGRSKALIVDSALALRLARLTPQALAADIGAEHFGSMLEGFVVAELLKQRGWSHIPFDLSHFRDRSGLEVDLIAELDDGRVIGIEVKATSTPRAEHFAGLRFLASRLGPRFAGGFVLGTSTTTYAMGDRLWAMPVSALWEW